MRNAFFLLLALLAVSSFSQVKKDEDRPIISLCWNSSLDTAADYLVYFRRYNNTDTLWRLIGSTNEKVFTIAKESLKGDVAFGVRAVYYGDTSAMHSSLEQTACLPSAGCDTTCSVGSWYISWHIGKPDRIKVIK